MLQEKTNGNLSPEESEILNVTLSEVRLAYVQATSTKSTVELNMVPPLSCSRAEGNNVQEIVERKKKFSKNYGS